MLQEYGIYIYISIYLPICQSIGLSIYLSIYRSIYLPTYLSMIYLSIYLPIYRSISLSLSFSLQCASLHSPRGNGNCLKFASPRVLSAALLQTAVDQAGGHVLEAVPSASDLGGSRWSGDGGNGGESWANFGGGSMVFPYKII